MLKFVAGARCGWVGGCSRGIQKWQIVQKACFFQKTIVFISVLFVLGYFWSHQSIKKFINHMFLHNLHNNDIFWILFTWKHWQCMYVKCFFNVFRWKMIKKYHYCEKVRKNKWFLIFFDALARFVVGLVGGGRRQKSNRAPATNFNSWRVPNILVVFIDSNQ